MGLKLRRSTYCNEFKNSAVAVENSLIVLAKRKRVYGQIPAC